MRIFVFHIIFKLEIIHRYQIETVAGRFVCVLLCGQFFAKPLYDTDGIIGFAELLQDETRGVIDECQTDYLAHILNSSNHLLGLIQDILELSSLEAGQVEMMMHPVLRHWRKSADNSKKSAKNCALHSPDSAKTAFDPWSLFYPIFSDLAQRTRFSMLE